MLKKLNPSLSFIVFAILLWLLQYVFDLTFGDGDGRVLFLGAYIFIGFLQVFFILATLFWLPEVFRRLKNNFAANSQALFKRNTISLFTTILLFFIILIDFFGFAILNEKSVEQTYKTRYYRTPHPCFHHGLVQNMKVETYWGDINYSLYTNSLAFKDSAAFQAKQNFDKKQIVFIGDSFTEGIGMEYENTFFGELRNKFSSNDSMELWNAGCISYSPLIYYNKIKYYLEVENFKIDYLYVFIDGSDIQDEVNYKDHIPQCSSKYVPKANTIEYYRYLQHQDKSLCDIYQNHSLFIRLFSNLYKKVFASSKLSSEEQYMKDRLSWISNDEVYEKWGKKGVKLAQNHMQSLVELCKRNDIELRIAVYPWFKMINDHERQLKIWTEFSRKNNIPLINLFPVFSKKVEETSFEEVNKKYFIQGDGHWNANGHKLVAESIEPIIRNDIMEADSTNIKKE